MPRYPGPSPYYPQGLLRAKILEMFEAYPDSTFMIKDMTRLVDSLVADEVEESRPVHAETMRKQLNALAEDPESPVHVRDSTDADYFRSFRTQGIRFYSQTNPVPVYTETMAELYDQIPDPRTFTPEERDAMRTTATPARSTLHSRKSRAAKKTAPAPAPAPVPTPDVMPKQKPVHIAAAANQDSDPAIEITAQVNQITSLVRKLADGVNPDPELFAENAELRAENRALRAQLAEIKNRQREAAKTLGYSVDTPV